MDFGGMPHTVGGGGKRIHIHFRVPFFTKWGQSLMLVGEGALLGNWSTKRGTLMRCHHEKEVLVWEALVTLPWAPCYKYKYVLVDGKDEEGDHKVDKGETCEHEVALPEGLKSGDIVEVLDTWVDRSYPGSILTSTAFSKVLGVTRTPLASPPSPPRREPLLGEVVVRLRVADYSLGSHQALYVSGSLPQLGAWQQDQMMPLTEVGGLWWEGELRVPYAAFPFTFKYAVKDVMHQPTGVAAVPGSSAGAPRAGGSGAAPAPGRAALAAGSAGPGGRGQAGGPIAASVSAGGAGAGAGGVPLHLAAAALQTTGDAGALLEVGEPRLVSLPLSGGANMGAPALLVCHDGYFRRDKMWRGAGVAVPVFSLRTKASVGCGDFLDLLQLVELCDMCGLRLVQLLPVNDTTVYSMWWDSYPYSTLSVFALHPQYLALRALRPVLPSDLQDELDATKTELERLRQIDYERTVKFKREFARKVFDRFGSETTQSHEFKEWVAANSVWLRPYAAFAYLRDMFTTAEHWQWGALAGPPSKETLDRLTSPHSDHYPSILFTYYVQYHLHCQLLQVTRAAEAARVVLKGDLPIGVDKRSVDTWVEPHLFRMDKSTGAPPDVFDAKGQNWGFPTYAWEAMAADNYEWWKRRLRHMAQYFHAYRIDHVLGFFRIWEIPGDCTTGMLGHFRPSVPIWRHELDSRGLHDTARLTQPYIRRHLLAKLFKEGLWQEVAAKYMVEEGEGSGVYRLRPQYASERAIQDIKVREDSPAWLLEETAAVRAGLMALRQNVVLLADPEDPDRFYPRFNLMATSSYKELPQHARDSLAWLHDDYYYRRQEEVWRASALAKLPVLQAASDMLVCGEDLGFVPACVPPVMQELGLVGLRIQRMPCEEGKEFNDPRSYPYMVVASPSCHDVQPLRAWYEADPERRERFYFNALGGSAPAAPAACTPDIAVSVAASHLTCPAVWTIFPIQDVMALCARYHDRPAPEEVINEPTTAKHYWRFRLHVLLEELKSDGVLVSTVQELLVMSGRATEKELPAL